MARRCDRQGDLPVSRLCRGGLRAELHLGSDCLRSCLQSQEERQTVSTGNIYHPISDLQHSGIVVSHRVRWCAVFGGQGRGPRPSEVYNGLWNSCLETSWARSIIKSKRAGPL